MKPKGLAEGLLVLSVLVALPALADDQTQRFKAADLNGDGYIDAAENTKFILSSFARVDSNGDGFQDKQEIFEDLRKRMDGVPEGKGKLPPSMMLVVDNAIKVKDRDGDGRVSLEEYKLDAENRFKELDANGDGKLSLDEMLNSARK